MTLVIDYSFASPDPAAIVAAGISGVLVYTGPARPDAATIADLRAHGLTVCLIQESDPNRSQQGRDAGIADAQYANSRADEVGYPPDCSIAYVVSDGSAGDPSSGADQIAAYAAGIASVGRRPCFYYGNEYACLAALQGDQGALGTWIPSTWGAGTLLTQEANTPSPIADTDLNTVHADYGAWGSQGATDMPLDDNDIAKVAAAIGGQNQALWGKYTNLGDLFNKLHADITALSAKVDGVTASGAGGGVSAAQVTAIVRAELDKTRLGH